MARDARPQEAAGAKVIQEVHHGIPLYHVAEIWAEKDEKSERKKGREESGWSGGFCFKTVMLK